MVLCDPQGLIVQVTHDGLGLADRLQLGQPFDLAISVEGSQEDDPHREDSETQSTRYLAQRFMETLRASGFVFGWELPVSIQGQVTALRFTGGATPDGLLIVAQAVPSEVGPLVEELVRINNETVNALRSAVKQATLSSQAQNERDHELLNELSRANNEVITVHRELAKRNALLSQTNATLEQAQRKTQELLGELRLLNQDLELRVQQRTAALELSSRDLQGAKEEAERANAAKSEFLSRMSHELRTPLNAILGFGQILGMQSLPPKSKEGVGHILKGGRHLLGLINEVLDITRVESGLVAISLEPISVDEVVLDVCALVRPLTAEHDIRLQEHTWDLGRSQAVADRQRLKQVLINLLANAIKYNRHAGEVEVSCEQRPNERIAIMVRDSGPGISPENLAKLFTPFERLEATDSAIEGTGLGLVLSQRLAAAMNGTLSVQSTLGQGTTFTLELPQATSPQASAALGDQGIRVADTSSGAEPVYKVLCIEDNPSNLRLIQVIFESRPQWALLAAIQGSVGLDMARQHEPDLILLDLNLPDLNGKEVLARLQGSATTKDIPVVVISADSTPKQVEQLLEAGAKAFLTKPLDLTQFLDTLDRLLSRDGSA